VVADANALAISDDQPEPRGFNIDISFRVGECVGFSEGEPIGVR